MEVEVLCFEGEERRGWMYGSGRLKVYFCWGGKVVR